MRTFHQDKSNSLKANLKTAAENTMKAVVRAGKSLSGHISRKAVVFAAVAALSMSGTDAQAQGFLGKILGGVEKTLAKVEKTAQDIGRPFYKLNRQFDSTQRAIEYTESDIRGTGERFSGVVAPVVNAVNNIRNQRKADQYLQQMEGQNIPLIAEEGGQNVAVSSGSQRTAHSNAAGVNVVSEVSLGELVSRNHSASAARNTTVSSSSERVSGSNNGGGEITLEELVAYTNAHSSSNGSSVAAVKARRAEVQGQSVGGSATQNTSQVKKQTRKLSTEELYAQMVKEGYVK